MHLNCRSETDSPHAHDAKTLLADLTDDVVYQATRRQGAVSKIWQGHKQLSAWCRRKMAVAVEGWSSDISMAKIAGRPHQP
jgi:hypothetical protein